MPDYNFTDRQKRELYKAYRSMHDGICPCCGSRGVSNRIGETGSASYSCARCMYVLGANEVEVITSWHGMFHEGVQGLTNTLRSQIDSNS